VFAELAVGDDAAGQPSVRTLLLLYASDLAYRLRSEVLPALALGHDVVVAPYVDTALAFSRVAGVGSPWIADIFGFAPQPALRYYVPSQGEAHSERQGFVELASRKLAPGAQRGGALLRETDRHLRGLTRLTGSVVL
jgi:thymidylate kinase